MRVEQLEYLAAVTRLGSLRRASEELHLSQPALSETLRNLERELGVQLLERKRSGAKISDEGRELLPHIAEVLNAVDQLRQAADEQHHISRRLRLGTVNAATVTLLAPAIREFRATHPSTPVEVIAGGRDAIQQRLAEGSFDLGLISYLHDDKPPPTLQATELLRGRPVVCVRPDSALAALTRVTVTDLLTEPLIMMRSGYAMHRFVHRLLSGTPPSLSYAAEGAEMCKLMVAEGLGATVLPDYSVLDDPLVRGGAISHRPLADDTTELRVMIHRRHTHPAPKTEQDLHAILVRRAAERRTRRPTDKGLC
ncbi:LysR family transcriptional regulator [Streptomyces sp. 71268]|uniref:LysR family transcriptional regulator n=1 Tax=Streptomyces sp. 71268 TaxID=3002640 RepID=UPI0023F8B858|nr:LysR family transcriptional regulator [Streptomyces sp. 71268]WEV26685.1 LysR family transcriptional regulator [Streptomyces sp. 71268]